MIRPAITNAEIAAGLQGVSEKLDGFIRLMDERDRLATFQRSRMESDSAALTKSVEAIVEAWKNASFVLVAVKWLSALVVAASALWFVVTHFGQGK